MKTGYSHVRGAEVEQFVQAEAASRLGLIQALIPQAEPANCRHWLYHPYLNMPTYVKRHWNELRGDAHHAWGTSWWYFEVDDKGRVLRQIEQYESGMRLRYGEQHAEDEFGGLAEKPLDLSLQGYSAISSQDFEAMWRTS